MRILNQSICRLRRDALRVALASTVLSLVLFAASRAAGANARGCVAPETAGEQPAGKDGSGQAYVLGPRDKLAIHVVDEDEIEDKPYAIDLNGDLALPRLGAVHAAGLTVSQLRNELTSCFLLYLKSPVVSVAVAEFASQPVTILGAVASPGIRQIEGRKTLFEVISEAGGLKDDAGNTITITRQMQNGVLPLPDAHVDSSGQFSVGEVTIRSIVRANDPSQNIAILPHDVITVPKAEMVYVVGAVRKAGGFVLKERSEMSVLELLSLAEGMERTAGGKNAKILRASGNSDHRAEVAIDLNRVIQGKSPDVNLKGNDILFVPNSTGKSASLRALEAIISTGSGLAIYHPY